MDDQGTARTWPFWAPSAASAVEAALELGGVGPGTRVLDLGCGDGQVVLAAARRGAAAGGIEADPALARRARRNLRAAGVAPDVRVADLLDPDTDLDADVLFTYLAPATLQRLLPNVRHRRGTRLVTVDFDVPGLTPNRRSGPARLYVLPGRRRRRAPVGWPVAGALVAAIPGCHSLTCLECTHPPGPTDVRVHGALAQAVTALPGADALREPGPLAVDLRWEPLDRGTVAAGTIRTAGLPPFPVVAVATEEDDGTWDLSEAGIEGIRRALRRRVRPTTLAELLDAATS